MALIDLSFASAKDRRKWHCATCRHKTPGRAEVLKCGEDDFNVLARKRQQVDRHGPRYSFCPGKATWYYDIARVFQECRVTLETGILPRDGGLKDQEDLFVHVFPTFVEHFRHRSYARVWDDVGEVIPKVLEVIASMFTGKKR